MMEVSPWSSETESSPPVIRKVFIVKATGPHALEVHVVRAEHAHEALILVPLSDAFDQYTVTEVDLDSVKIEVLFKASYIE